MGVEIGIGFRVSGLGCLGFRIQTQGCEEFRKTQGHMLSSVPSAMKPYD